MDLAKLAQVMGCDMHQACAMLSEGKYTNPQMKSLYKRVHDSKRLEHVGCTIGPIGVNFEVHLPPNNRYRAKSLCIVLEHGCPSIFVRRDSVGDQVVELPSNFEVGDIVQYDNVNELIQGILIWTGD